MVVGIFEGSSFGFSGGNAPRGPEGSIASQTMLGDCTAHAVLRVIDEMLQLRYGVRIDCDEARPCLARDCKALAGGNAADLLYWINDAPDQGFLFKQKNSDVMLKLHVGDVDRCSDFDQLCGYLEEAHNLAWVVIVIRAPKPKQDTVYAVAGYGCYTHFLTGQKHILARKSWGEGDMIMDISANQYESHFLVPVMIVSACAGKMHERKSIPGYTDVYKSLEGVLRRSIVVPLCHGIKMEHDDHENDKCPGRIQTAASSPASTHPQTNTSLLHRSGYSVSLNHGDASRILWFKLSVEQRIACVVRAMRRREGIAGVQEMACRALSMLAKTQDNMSKIVSSGGLIAILCAMSTHSGNLSVVENACKSLRSLAVCSPHKVEIAAVGGIEAIVHAMRTHPNALRLQEAACAALWSMAVHDVECKERIAREGGIHAIVRAMGSNTHAAGLQEKGCGALSSLATDADNKKYIAAEGGIQMVLMAMKAHVQHARVQERGCGALLNLGMDAEVRSKIVSKGGVDAIVCAMRAHVGDVHVQEMACGALLSLSKHQDSELKAAGEGGIEAIVYAMQRHLGSSDMLDKACGALWSLAKHQHNKVRIAAAGGIQAIVRAMERHLRVCSVQERACGGLYNLAMDPENRDAIAHDGGIRAVVTAMHAHTSVAAVQQLGCCTLQHLAKSPSIKPIIAAEGGVDATVRAILGTHASNVCVHEAAYGVLRHLATDADVRGKILAATQRCGADGWTRNKIAALLRETRFAR